MLRHEIISSGTIATTGTRADSEGSDPRKKAGGDDRDRADAAQTAAAEEADALGDATRPLTSESARPIIP
jgi:hypothetical protein